MINQKQKKLVCYLLPALQKKNRNDKFGPQLLLDGLSDRYS